MKYIKSIAFAAAFIMLLTLAACSAKPAIVTTPVLPTAATTTLTTAVTTTPPTAMATASPSPAPGQIFLYGEQHAVTALLDKEFALWSDDYHNKNMRHLFVELPYFTAEFLNLWMKSDSDDIFNEVYNDWTGSADHSPIVKEFYQKIKKECPETTFHGTDVGHEYNSTGTRYLKYLEDNQLLSSKQYSLAQENIEQGRYYYSNAEDAVYRENKMAENFIREFDSLGGIDVMGIYGSAHTGLDAMDYSNAVPCMANQIRKHYGDTVHSGELPEKVDTISVDGKDYAASYFGKQDMSSWSKDFNSREFWRLDNAYDDFKNNLKTGKVLPYNNYPMQVVAGQVFVQDYTKKDGSVIRVYYRSDGYIWKGLPTTEEFTVQ